MSIKGLDKDLAKAIDKGFSEFYIKWTRVNGSRASPKEKVIFFVFKGNQVLAQIQADQWVSGWRQHLGDRATPKDLVDAIVGNIETLGKAKKLKEEIIKEFTVVDPSSL